MDENDGCEHKTRKQFSDQKKVGFGKLSFKKTEDQK